MAPSAPDFPIHDSRFTIHSSSKDEEPCVLFFNINGSGLGHMNRCLAYARRLRGRARPVFFSLASAIEIIEEMGFEADYLVSPFWSRTGKYTWNRELSIRLGMMLEQVQPQVVVFDGTWPFHGFMDACVSYGVRHLVWSNRGLHKSDMTPVSVSESSFDLVLEPGEIGTHFEVEKESAPGRRVKLPPVTLLRNEEVMTRAEARSALGLSPDAAYALFSLGPGNLKDVSGIGHGLIEEMRGKGYTVLWARAPISVRDVPLPGSVQPLSVYPLARYMRAFDVFVGAAGYNSCCEVIQSQVPSLLVPNTELVDDQALRARMVAEHAPAVVSPCETREQRTDAVRRLLTLVDGASERTVSFDMDGAERGADEILALMGREAAK